MGLHLTLLAVIISIVVCTIASFVVPGEYKGVSFWLTISILVGSVWTTTLIIIGIKQDDHKRKDPVTAGFLISLVVLFLIISFITILGFAAFGKGFNNDVLISDVFDNESDAYSYSYTSTSSTESGLASRSKQNFLLSITRLPVGGASYAIAQTNEDGSWHLNDPRILNFGINNITIPPSEYNRTVKICVTDDVAVDKFIVNDFSILEIKNSHMLLFGIIIVEATLIFVFGYLIFISMNRDKKPSEIIEKENKQKFDASRLTALSYTLSNIKSDSAEVSILRDKIVKKIALIQTRLSRSITTQNGIYSGNTTADIEDQINQLNNLIPDLISEDNLQSNLSNISVLVNDIDLNLQNYFNN